MIEPDGIPTAVKADQSSAADATPVLTSDSANCRARGTAAAAAGDRSANAATVRQQASQTLAHKSEQCL